MDDTAQAPDQTEKRNSMNEELMHSALKLLVALPVVILLAYISLRLTNRQMYRQGPGKGIQVLERVPLQNKSQLCIVRMFDEVVVIGAGENNVQLIKTLTREEAESYLAHRSQRNAGNDWGKSILAWTKGKKQHEE